MIDRMVTASTLNCGISYPLALYAPNLNDDGSPRCISLQVTHPRTGTPCPSLASPITLATHVSLFLSNAFSPVPINLLHSAMFPTCCPIVFSINPPPVSLSFRLCFVFHKLPATFGGLVVAVDKINFDRTLGIPHSDHGRGRRVTGGATGGGEKGLLIASPRGLSGGEGGYQRK